MWGQLIGAGIGALAGGATGKQDVPNLVTPEQIKSYSGPLGTATSTGFTYAPAAGTAPITSAARQNLLDIVGGGLTFNPALANQYQTAYMQQFQPQLEQNIAQERQRMEAANAAKGLSGSSGAILGNQLFGTQAEQQRQALLGQAFMGGQNLMQQELGRRLSALNAFQGLSQQDIANALQASGQTQQARIGSQQNELNYNRALNEVLAANAKNKNQAQQSFLGNIAGGAQAGFSLGGAF